MLAIDSAAGQLTPVFIGERGILRGLTSHELERLGLDGLIGVDFRNSTHFGDV
jgi:predicted ATP-grasp superfamily ATP-dependent carboligase